MDYTSDNTENEITLLPSLLKMFLIFQMHFWYDKEHDYQNNMETIAIRCSNRGKKTCLSMKI